MAENADAVVIGAGVMGASIGFHLARAGISPLIVEQHTAASQSTGRSGAMVRMHYTNEPEASMALASLPYFQRWEDHVGAGSCGFVECGFAVLVGPQEVDRLRRNTLRLQELGVVTEVVQGERLREMAGGMAIDDVGAAALEPQSGYANPVLTTRGFLLAAARAGAVLREGTRATAIRVSHGRVESVATTGGTIASPIVVSAAGCYSEPLLRTANVDVSIRPSRAQVAFFRRPPALAGHPGFIDTILGMYGRPDGDGTTLIGVGGDEEKPADPDRFQEANDPSYVQEAGRRAGRRFPALRGAAYAHGHAGLYDMSQDTRALIGPAPGVEGLYVAAGFSGTGFKKAPAVGICLSELITTGKAVRVDLHPFRLTRFDEGEPIVGDEYTLPAHFGHRL